MLVFFGWRDREEDAGLTGEVHRCRRCGATSRLRVVRVRRRLHVFWIPATPLVDAYGVLVCPACGNTGAATRRELRRVEQTGRIPS